MVDSEVFDVRSVVLVPQQCASKVLCSSFDATGSYFVTGCSDNVARVWAVSPNNTAGTYSGYYFCLPPSPNCLPPMRYFISRVEPYWTLEGHARSVHCALFSNNSDRILTAYSILFQLASLSFRYHQYPTIRTCRAWDGMVKIWRVEDRSFISRTFA